MTDEAEKLIENFKACEKKGKARRIKEIISLVVFEIATLCVFFYSKFFYGDSLKWVCIGAICISWLIRIILDGGFEFMTLVLIWVAGCIVGFLAEMFVYSKPSLALVATIVLSIIIVCNIIKQAIKIKQKDFVDPKDLVGMSMSNNE